jgi:hypothetical protein
MKKQTYLSLLFILFTIQSHAFIIHDKNSITDTLNEIHKISFYQNMRWWEDQSSLLNGHRFFIIFMPNGKVVLKWPDPCNPNNRNFICSYTGWIRPSVFKRLVNYLYQIRFLELKERYIEDRDEEVDREKGHAVYFIDYNEKYIKKITDYRLDVPELKPLHNRILKLKKKIKWTPTLIDSN